jgi:nucleoside 2-deoxyribosyltransferase
MMHYCEELKQQGFTICCRWVYGGEEGLSQEDIAILDLEDVDEAECILSFTEPRDSYHRGGGRHTEFGYAYAKNKLCCIIGGHEQVFHHLPLVEHYDNLGHFIKTFRNTN